MRPTPQSSPKVTFDCHKDGFLKRSVSFYDVDLWSINDNTTYQSTSNCDQVTHPKEVSSLGNQIKTLRSLIQSIQQSDLNIPTSSDTFSAPGYLERRHSMLNLGQTGRQHRQDSRKASPSSLRVPCHYPPR